MIGGSSDPECKMVVEAVQSYQLGEGVFLARKGMAYRRGKVGVCPVELKVHG